MKSMKLSFAFTVYSNRNDHEEPTEIYFFLSVSSFLCEADASHDITTVANKKVRPAFHPNKNVQYHMQPFCMTHWNIETSGLDRLNATALATESWRFHFNVINVLGSALGNNYSEQTQ